MDLSDSPFYASGTFWAAAGTIVGVASIVVIALVTLRAANPRRRLWYSISSATPLVAREQDVARELVIFYRGDQLDLPHTANINLISRGRLDIPRTAFDGQPLRLDMGAPIVAILAIVTARDRILPSVRSEASTLAIGPALIGKRETIMISILTDGEPELGWLPQSLENVDIRRGEPRDSLAGRDRNRMIAIMAILLVATVAILVTYLLTRQAQTHTPGTTLVPYGP
jgi:hypothetical protein